MLVWMRGRQRRVDLNYTPFPWVLTVDLNVRYDFITRRSSEPQWTETEITQWKRNFETAVQRTWSHRWLLVGEVEHGLVCDGLISRGYGPHARSRWGACEEPDPTDVVLRIVEVTGQTRSQVMVHPVVIFRRRAGVQTQFIDDDASTGELDDSFIFARDDVTVTPSSDGTPQIGAAHEVGHALGLRHPGEDTEDCRIARRSAPAGVEPLVCYGDEGGRDTIMGTGMYIRRSDYEIFADVMNRLIPHAQWSVSSRRPHGGAYHRRELSMAGEENRSYRQPTFSPHSVRYFV